MILLLWWSREYPVIEASKEAEVKEDTACDIYQWLREVCCTKLISMPIVLGGPGKIVQIDESLFRHKPKVGNYYICVLLVNSSLQNHRGRPTSTEKWVFGIVDTSFSPSLELVPNRQAATLLPIIQARVARGTTVYSDEWSAYRQLSKRLLQVASHGTVNHSLHFVNPVSGVHMQNIESYWNRAKLKLKRMKGCHADQLPSYLDEFMWRERFGETSRNAWNNIILHISQQCPVQQKTNMCNAQSKTFDTSDSSICMQLCLK